MYKFVGYVGGNFFNEKGGGVNYLCLDENPEWGNRIDGLQGHTRIYGSEFDSHHYEQIFSKANNGGRSLDNLDAICADLVCTDHDFREENMSCRMDDGISRISGD